MIALKAEDVKTFTSKLFLKEDFDSFLVKEVNIVTYHNFTIDGHIRQGYYTNEELEENRIESFSSWKVLRPVCFLESQTFFVLHGGNTFVGNRKVLYTAPVSYTHLDVYKRQSYCRSKQERKSIRKSCTIFYGVQRKPFSYNS